MTAKTKHAPAIDDASQNENTSGKFTGRLDMTLVGVFGHSFGGAQAAQFCSQDSIGGGGPG